MKRQRLDTTGGTDNALLAAAAAVAAVGALGGVWLCQHLAARLDGRQAPTRDPLRLFLDTASGRVPWPDTATTVAITLGLALAVLVFAGVLLWPRRSRPEVDRSARHMGTGPAVGRLTAEGSKRIGARLGHAAPGLPLGRAVAGGRPLFMTWEDVGVLIAGPRTQKTSAYAVPCVLAAPGPCFATSNKRDLSDLTAGYRATRGAVWTFDPERVADGGPAPWAWDPLTFVAPVDPSTGRARRLPSGQVDASETRAQRLAAQLATSARPAGAKLDAYFDQEAETLLALLLLAAAVSEVPITAVFRWLTDPEDDTPAKHLARHGFDLQRASLVALTTLPDKQREGVYGTARGLVGWLTNRAVVPWVTPDEDRPTFAPEAFAGSTDTLYLLSREGTASVAPLVAALTLAVLVALEERATAAGGRLPVPAVGVLDEAANVARLRDLAALYSHAGSRGIVLLTILQSWAQGANAWGADGMEALWSAANVRLYGGGSDDDRFLQRLSNAVGTAEQMTRSASVGAGKRTVTRSVRDVAILTPAELRSLPPGRALLLPSGMPPLLVRAVPWWEGPHAAEVKASAA